MPGSGNEPPSDSADRCPWAITFGSLSTRCYLGPHGGSHHGHGLEQFPYQIIEWYRGDRREFETDREDIYAWEG